ASGALESPLLPVLVANAIYLGIFCPSPRAARIATATQVALVWIFVALQIKGVVPALFPQVSDAVGSAAIFRPIALASVITLLSYVGQLGGVVMQENRREMRRRMLSVCNDVLRDHAEQGRALTTLSGEIAHELKNPLASVKGLAALLAKDFEGESARQLAVLRR